MAEIGKRPTGEFTFSISLVNDISEKDLVARAAAGDRDSFRELFHRYEGKVSALAYEILRSREDAEDVTQDAFVKAFLSLSEFKGQSSFYTWLYRIVFNLSIDLKRKLKRRGGVGIELNENDGSVTPSEIISTVESPFSAVLRREQSEIIRKALDEISEDHRAVIVLREIDGLSYEEIARITGVTRGTVMSRLHYARKKLQKALAEVAPRGGGPRGGHESAKGVLESEKGESRESSEAEGRSLSGALSSKLMGRSFLKKQLGSVIGVFAWANIILNFFS